MDGFSLETPEQVSRKLAARIKALRLAKGWKQVTLGERSGVSLASLRRFEESGRVSLHSLLDLAFALNREGARHLFPRPPWGHPRGVLDVRAPEPSQRGIVNLHMSLSSTGASSAVAPPKM